MRWEEVVGRNIRVFRRARGLTQEALALAAGIDTRYVGGIERGEENPTIAVLGRIASVLGTEPGTLLAVTLPTAGPILRMKQKSGRARKR